MIKGAQRRMVMMKTPENRMYESVLFIMRSDADNTHECVCCDDMLTEAGRIIGGCTTGEYNHHVRKGKKRIPDKLIQLLLFAGGVISGGGAVGLIMLIK